MKRFVEICCVLLLLFVLEVRASAPMRHINWSTSTGMSNLLPTLQVVVNPLMNPWRSPVARDVWMSLKSLNATRVRYAGWFPYPQWTVAELYAPDVEHTCCHWNFTGLMSQLEHFMESTSPPNVLSLSTAPLWMFAGTATTPWSPDPKSNEVAWGYSHGQFHANSTYQMAEYYGRVASWLINGEMTDEFGRKVAGGPAYGVEKVGTWEVFNEPEAELRGGGPMDYVASFDAIVRKIREVADPDHKLEFQGLALEGHAEWDWWSAYLDPANHDPLARDAINWASFHFYSFLHDRVVNTSWESELFQTCDDFIQECSMITALRDKLSPKTKLSIDEMGTILSNDNDKSAPIPNHLYFVASGSMYAYAFGKLSLSGVDVLGMSQLAGTPVIPQFGITDPQYPSVSMVNWTTGEGNARFWVLFLIRKYFDIGDVLFEAQIVARPAPCASSYMMDLIRVGFTHKAEVRCPASAPIKKIAFAAQGDISGSCDNGFEWRSRDCHDHGAVWKYVSEHCIGKASCTIDAAANAQYFDNCSKTYTKRLVLRVECDGGAVGIGKPSAYLSDQVYVQGRLCMKDGRKRILLVNKNNMEATLFLSPSGSDASYNATLPSMPPTARNLLCWLAVRIGNIVSTATGTHECIESPIGAQTETAPFALHTPTQYEGEQNEKIEAVGVASEVSEEITSPRPISATQIV